MPIASVSSSLLPFSRWLDLDCFTDLLRSTPTQARFIDHHAYFLFRRNSARKRRTKKGPFFRWRRAWCECESPRDPLGSERQRAGGQARKRVHLLLLLRVNEETRCHCHGRGWAVRTSQPEGVTCQKRSPSPKLGRDLGAVGRSEAAAELTRPTPNQPLAIPESPPPPSISYYKYPTSPSPNNPSSSPPNATPPSKFT